MAAYTANTTLSSAGVSATLTLDPTAKTTTVSYAVTTTASSGDATIQANLWQPGSAGTVSWVVVSSHISSSTASPDGTFLSLLTPVAGLRISSTSWAAGTATLQALQSVTA